VRYSARPPTLRLSAVVIGRRWPAIDIGGARWPPAPASSTRHRLRNCRIDPLNPSGGNWFGVRDRGTKAAGPLMQETA